ncbi:MAG: hypothetical protein ABL871_17465 [Terricaulis sp.]
MRPHIIAALLLASAQVVVAQEVIAPPTAQAPAATAPFDERAQWCDAYATWLVAMSETTQQAPADVRASQRVEVEINACKLDPQDYERDTRAEAELAVETAQG